MAESGAGSRLVDSQGKPLGAAPVGGVPVGSAMSDSFSFNMKGLKDLEGQIQTLITKFDTLDKKIQSVNGSLGKSGGAMGPSSPNLTISSFSNTASPVNQKLAQFGGTASGYPQGPGGPGNTTAPVSAFGGGAALKWAVGGEMASSAGGFANTQMNQLKGGYTGLQAQAAQSGAITGAGLTTTTAAFAGLKNQGPQDLGSAIASLQQNPFVAPYLGKPGKSWNNISSFINSVQGLAPTQGAQGAAGLINALLSPQATQFSAMRTGGRAGIFNPRTGQFNNPQQSLDTMIATALGQSGITGKNMSALFKGVASNPEQLAILQGNLTTSPIGPGLSSQYMPQIEQLLKAGGNLQGAQQPISGTVASTMLSRTSAGTATGMYGINATTPILNQLNKVATGLQTFQGYLAKTFPGLTNMLGGMAKFTSTALQAASALAMIAAAKSLSGGGSGLLGGLLGGGGKGIIGGLWNTIKTKAGSAIKAFGQGDIIAGAEDAGVAALAAAPEVAAAGDPVGTGGMMPNLAMGINAMKRANPNIQINSGYRSPSQQAALYAAKGGQGVARPGQSPHQLGKAADIGPASQYAWIAANAPRYGLASDRGEPWHVQAMGDPNTASTITGAQVVSGAQSQIGANYVYGAESAGKTAAQGSFDCSGLVQYVYQQLGISLPRTTFQQVKCGSAVKSLAQAQPGDLIFYAGTDGTASNPGHVAIYIGGGQQIAAPHTGTKVQTQPVDTGSIVAIRRIVGGGAGKQVAAAAQSAVGSSSNDSHGSGAAMAGGGAMGLGNTFVANLSNSSWNPMGGGSGGGSLTGMGGSGGGTTTTAGGSGGGTGGATSSASLSTTPSSAGALSPSQVASYWIKAGGPAGVAATMAGIAMSESSDIPSEVQKGQPYATTGWGLWQITPGNSESQIGKDQQLLDPLTNAKAALAKYQGAGNTLRPWKGDGYMVKNNVNPNTSGVGDPSSFSPNVPGMTMGGAAGTTMGMRRGGGTIQVSIGPVMVNNQADANNIPNMIAAAIRNNSDIQKMANS